MKSNTFIGSLLSKISFDNKKSPNSEETIQALWRLEKIILDTLDFKEVVQKIVDSVLIELGYLNLGYCIVVLALIDEEKKVLRRISTSQTPEAEKALRLTPVPFQEIVIPLADIQNGCIKAIHTKEPFTTHDWAEILQPTYTVEEARTVQKTVGIKSSVVYPVGYHDKIQGVIIFSMTKTEDQVSVNEKDLIRSFTDVVGLAVQNAKLYTSAEVTKQQLGLANGQLQEANSKLQELDKLKDEFVSLASHELRTPMTAIRGSISTILEGYVGDVSPQAKEFLTAAYNENDRLIRLVNNLLNISRIESGRFDFNFENTNINDLITDVVHNLQIAAKEKNIFLTYDSNRALPSALADIDKVKEVLINLIGNAIKFTYQGGITIKVMQKDGMITISVCDTGPGIAKEDQEILFQKFSQVQKGYTKQTGGTGLGLYISKQIIEGHKGKIWLESEVSKGSSFNFSLPIAS